MQHHRQDARGQIEQVECEVGHVCERALQHAKRTLTRMARHDAKNPLRGWHLEELQDLTAAVRGAIGHLNAEHALYRGGVSGGKGSAGDLHIGDTGPSPELNEEEERSRRELALAAYSTEQLEEALDVSRCAAQKLAVLRAAANANAESVNVDDAPTPRTSVDGHHTTLLAFTHSAAVHCLKEGALTPLLCQRAKLVRFLQQVTPPPPSEEEEGEERAPQEPRLQVPAALYTGLRVEDADDSTGWGNLQGLRTAVVVLGGVTQHLRRLLRAREEADEERAERAQAAEVLHKEAARLASLLRAHVLLVGLGSPTALSSDALLCKATTPHTEVPRQQGPSSGPPLIHAITVSGVCGKRHCGGRIASVLVSADLLHRMGGMSAAQLEEAQQQLKREAICLTHAQYLSTPSSVSTRSPCTFTVNERSLSQQLNKLIHSTNKDTTHASEDNAACLRKWAECDTNIFTLVDPAAVEAAHFEAEAACHRLYQALALRDALKDQQPPCPAPAFGFRLGDPLQLSPIALALCERKDSYQDSAYSWKDDDRGSAHTNEDEYF